VDPDTTILLTHCPPYGILDDMRDSPKNWKKLPGHPGPRRLGSHVVRKLHSRLHKLRAHCFGHIHEKGDKSHTSRGVRFSNAAETMNYFEL
jgi:Icc-related predicted phosphoesterase